MPSDRQGLKSARVLRRSRDRQARDQGCHVVKNSLFDRERLKRVLDHRCKEIQTDLATILKTARNSSTCNAKPYLTG